MLEPGLYCMDCMDGMKQFPDGFFDLAVVDPPYGINVAHHDGGKVVGGGVRPFGGKHSLWGKHESESAPKFYHTFADDRPPDEGYFDELKRVSRFQIIWGGNFMLDYLGRASCMIVWDKGRRGLDQADCEIAWTNLPGQSRIFNYVWNGMLQQNMKNKEERFHPTQKPVDLYSWILERYAKPGYKILDTHAGSAGSLVACRKAGLDGWGFEIDPVYYEKAMERLQAARDQVMMIDLIQEAQGAAR